MASTSENILLYEKASFVSASSSSCSSLISESPRTMPIQCSSDCFCRFARPDLPASNRPRGRGFLDSLWPRCVALRSGESPLPLESTCRQDASLQYLSRAPLLLAWPGAAKVFVLLIELCPSRSEGTPADFVRCLRDFVFNLCERTPPSFTK